MPKSKADADKPLYQYQRQLKSPKILSQKYPNIARVLDPYAMDRSDDKNYNVLGENVEQDGDPFSWYRDAEETSTDALSKDIYGTQDPYELAKKIADEKGLNYKVKSIPVSEAQKKKMDGVYNSNDNTLGIKEGMPLNATLDTIVHEAGHAKDSVDNFEAFAHNKPAETTKYPGMKLDYDLKNLHNMSKNVSDGHFNEPGSHSINELLRATKAGMAKEGIYPEPDDDVQYDSLNAIKPIVKRLEGYAPPPETNFAKLRSLFNK